MIRPKNCKVLVFGIHQSHPGKAQARARFVRGALHDWPAQSETEGAVWFQHTLLGAATFVYCIVDKQITACVIIDSIFIGSAVRRHHLRYFCWLLTFCGIFVSFVFIAV